MITNVNERSNTLFIKNKYTDAIALQQLQNQSKTLRNLYSIYNDNINLLSKNYKICLGQIQTMPKIKVSREETQHTLQHLKRIYPKFQNKLIRDSINRNSFIRKSYEDYINYYEKTNDAQMQQISQDEKLKINQNSYTQSAKNMYGKGLVRPNISSLSNKRPLSSKNYNKTVNLNILNQAYQSFNNTGTYKMRTISGINYDNHYQTIRYTGYNATINPQKNQNIFSRPKKVFFYGQKRYEENIEENKKYQQFLFDGTQIIIRQRKNKQNNKQIISNNGFICINSLSSSNNKNKIITSSKYAQRKSIDQIQRMQIQNRILMVNSALSVGLTPSQGYRPKSRCWQNYFN